MNTEIAKYIPKPIIEMLGDPKRIKFIIKDNRKNRT